MHFMHANRQITTLVILVTVFMALLVPRTLVAATSNIEYLAMIFGNRVLPEYLLSVDDSCQTNIEKTLLVYSTSLHRLISIRQQTDQKLVGVSICPSVTIENQQEPVNQYWYGRALLQSGRVEDAVRYLAAAESGRYLYRYTQEISLARQVAAMEVQQKPECASCWVFYGDTMTGLVRDLSGYQDYSDGEQPDWKEANLAYQKALQLNPNSPEALSALAFSLYASKQDVYAAMLYLSRAISLEKSQITQALWSMRRGIWLREQGRVDEAIESLVFADSLMPNHCSVLLELATAYLASEDSRSLATAQNAMDSCSNSVAAEALLREAQRNDSTRD